MIDRRGALSRGSARRAPAGGGRAAPAEEPALEGPALVVHADGASRGNPGPAGAGAVIMTSAGTVIEELARYLGRATNNIAEYRALILGLEAARRRGAAAVTVRMDSELVVRQVVGTYKVRNANLRELHGRVKDLCLGFRRFKIEYVPRAANEVADRLANQAIDDAL